MLKNSNFFELLNQTLMALLSISCMFLFMGIFSQCSSAPRLKTVEQIDINKFVGKWYVIANIPTFIEKNAYSPVESYYLEKDGTIQTVFTFREGSFDGQEKTYKPRGFIKDKTNAIWGMQFIWPIEAEYLIVHVDESYSETIIARSNLDYVWIMARTPKITDESYQRLIKKCTDIGYDISKIKKAPQKDESL